jgi:hypothetical protein
MPQVRLAEHHKKAGICYAVTDDGLELPVVDVTHPAFQLELSSDKQRAMVAHFLEQQRRFARLPKLVRRPLLRFSMRGSVMARGLRRAEGTFLDGMTTYLFKLGAKNLGSYSVPVDRKMASSLPGLSVRLRLADMARLMADALAPRLAAQPERPLHFLNIAGGPAIDSLNALLLLRREQPALLSGRRCRVCVLDGDAHGPAFGARALAALQASGAPLAGLDAEFVAVPYDWREASGLTPVIDAARREGAWCIGSSEGGLFEYGSDRDVLANLRALAVLDDDFCMVGSVTRDDEVIRTLKLTSTAATLPRGLQVFSALVADSGFRVVHSIARPLSDQVVLQPLPGRLRSLP